MIIEKSFLKEINSFIYKKKHLIIYIFIGIFSLLFELGIRIILTEVFNEKSFLLHSSVLFGIFFAFYFNIKFNFNVPKLYLKRSLAYFLIISFSSYVFQFFIKSKMNIESLSFEQTRFLISGMFFLVGYFFHLKFSFKPSSKLTIGL